MGRWDGGIKDKGNGKIGGGAEAGKKGSRHWEERRKRFGRGWGKEGGKLLRVYSAVL